MNKLKALLENGSKVKLTVDTTPAAPDTVLKPAKTPEAPKKPSAAPPRLTALACAFSVMAAVIIGYIAYTNNWIINSRYDRPVTIPGFEQPVYLPVNLIAMALAGFLSVWILYIIVRIILSLTGSGKQHRQTSQAE